MVHRNFYLTRGFLIVGLVIFLSAYSDALSQKFIAKSFLHDRQFYGIGRDIDTKITSKLESLIVGHDHSFSVYYRGYLQFDLSSIPEYATLKSVKLTMGVEPNYQGGIVLRKMNSPLSTNEIEGWNELWGEKTILKGYIQNERIVITDSKLKQEAENVIMKNEGSIQFGVLRDSESTSLFILFREDLLSLDVTYEIPQPQKPSELHVSNITNNSCDLEWNEVTENIEGYDINIDGYHIYKDGQRIATTDNTGYIVSGLIPATSYRLSVSAFSDAGESPKNEITLLTKPSNPNNLSATNISCKGVDLQWSIVPGQISGYKIYCDGQLFNTVESTTTNYSVSGLAQKTQYNFTVKAYNSSGESYNNPSVDIETLENEHIPYGPYANVTYNSNGTANVRLWWGLPGSDSYYGIQYYRVYYWIGNSIVVAPLTTSRYFEFSNLSRGVIHRFSITSFNGVCESYETESFDIDLTNCVNPPSKPSNLEFTPHNYSGGIQSGGEVTWSAGGTSYNLWLMDGLYNVVQYSTTTDQSYHFYNLNGEYKLLIEAINDCGSSYSDLLYFTIPINTSLKIASRGNEDDLFKCISAINQY
ncbi:fibronectin type III domain-containing protein [Anaerophaga thermohalophila]|uniref:fibronectin type III domain-containing protein n=1 Tax=Anaerophaga thermohalophila TaxID=177400 RepID=UPI0002F68690|nr:fibronectin type III domain-containing protein [Anaerophaga thermohalophila]